MVLLPSGFKKEERKKRVKCWEFFFGPGFSQPKKLIQIEKFQRLIGFGII